MVDGRSHRQLVTAGLSALAVAAWLAPVVMAGYPGGAQADAPPAASLPNQQLIAFLRSPIGVATEVIVLTIGSIGWTVGVAHWLERRESPDGSPTTKSARKRARRRPAPDRRSGAAAAISRILVGLATAVVLILPMTFSILIGDDVFALPKTIGLLAFGVAITATLIALVAAGARPRRPGVLALAAMVFVALTALATVTSTDPVHSVVGEHLQYQGLLTTLTYVLLFTAAAVSITTVGRVRVFVVAALASATVAALYALVQWFGFDPIWDELYKDRVFSTVGQANALATTLAGAVIVSAGLASVPGRWRRVTVAGCAAFCLAALVLTFSRGGYVAFTAGVVVVALVIVPGVGRSGFRRVSRPVLAGMAAAVLIVGVVAFTWQPANDLMSRVAARTMSIANPTEGSNRIHLELWTIGLNIAIDHPVLGTGPDTFALVFPEYRDVVLPPDRAEFMARFRPESPHNVYLSIASGAGFPALAAFIILVASCLWLGIRAAVRTLVMPKRLALAGLMGALTVHLTTIVFMTAEPATFAIMWILLGTLVGFSRTLLATPEEKVVAPAR